MPLGRKVGLGPSDIMLDEDPVPSPQKGADSPFTAHVYCGQTAEWIKIPLSTEVGRGPDHIVLDGNPALHLKGAQPPNFRPMSVVAKRSPISATAEHLNNAIIFTTYRNFTQYAVLPYSIDQTNFRTRVGKRCHSPVSNFAKC